MCISEYIFHVVHRYIYLGGRVEGGGGYMGTWSYFFYLVGTGPQKWQADRWDIDGLNKYGGYQPRCTMNSYMILWWFHRLSLALHRPRDFGACHHASSIFRRLVVPNKLTSRPGGGGGGTPSSYMYICAARMHLFLTIYLSLATSEMAIYSQ